MSSGCAGAPPPPAAEARAPQPIATPLVPRFVPLLGDDAVGAVADSRDAVFAATRGHLFRVTAAAPTVTEIRPLPAGGHVVALAAAGPVVLARRWGRLDIVRTEGPTASVDLGAEQAGDTPALFVAEDGHTAALSTRASDGREETIVVNVAAARVVVRVPGAARGLDPRGRSVFTADGLYHARTGAILEAGKLEDLTWVGGRALWTDARSVVVYDADREAVTRLFVPNVTECTLGRAEAGRVLLSCDRDQRFEITATPLGLRPVSTEQPPSTPAPTSPGRRCEPRDTRLICRARLVAEGRLAVATSPGRLVVFDPSDGRPVARLGVPDDGRGGQYSVSSNGRGGVAVAGPGTVRELGPEGDPEAPHGLGEPRCSFWLNNNARTPEVRTFGDGDRFYFREGQVCRCRAEKCARRSLAPIVADATAGRALLYANVIRCRLELARTETLAEKLDVTHGRDLEGACQGAALADEGAAAWVVHQAPGRRPTLVELGVPDLTIRRELPVPLWDAAHEVEAAPTAGLVVGRKSVAVFATRRTPGHFLEGSRIDRTTGRVTARIVATGATALITGPDGEVEVVGERDEGLGACVLAGRAIPIARCLAQYERTGLFRVD